MWPIQSDSGSNWGGGGGGDVLWLCGETQQIFNDTVQHGYKAGGVWLYEPPQDHLYYWLKYLLARWEPNGEDWPRDSIFLQTLKGRDAGKDSERRAPGAQGQPGDTTEVDQSGEGRDVSPPPTRLPAPKPPPSVICMLEKQRQDSTERAAAFIFSIPPVPSVVRGKYLTLLRAGPPAPLPPPQQDLRCIICDETFAPGLHGLIGIYLGIFTASISQFPPSTLPSGHPRECLIALENVLTVDSL